MKFQIKENKTKSHDRTRENDGKSSPWSFLIMLLYIPIIHIRIKNEEKVLTEGLKGYKEYKQKVKYKVIPFVW